MRAVLRFLIVWSFAGFTLIGAHAQSSGRVSAMVKALEASEVVFQEVQPFLQVIPPSSLTLPPELHRDAYGLLPDLEYCRQITEERPPYLDVQIPAPDGGMLTLRVYAVYPFRDGARVRYSDGRIDSAFTGAWYRGMVRGVENSLVALSFYPDHVRGFASMPSGNYILGPMEDHPGFLTHLFYNDRTIAHLNPFYCSTGEDIHISPGTEGEHHQGASRGTECVAMHWEVDYDVYLDKFNNTTNFITGMANEVYTLFENDGITIETNLIYIWTSASPYVGPTDGEFLAQFRDQYNGNYNGDLGHLVNYKGSGGVAYLDGLCIPPFNTAYSNIWNTYQNVPTYSWTIMVCAHEIGHNLGSPHTHACAWNGNNTRIDNCGGNAGYPEGMCSSNPPNPPNGGTIMSYCHLIAGVGINFNEGFGPQPSELMQNRIDNAGCLVGCGNTPSCSFTLECPGTYTVQCDQDYEPWLTGEPQVVISGICENDPVVDWEDDLSALNGCNGTGNVFRTFTATEGFFSATCVQVINVVDQIPPVLLAIGEDMTLQCDEPIPAPHWEAFDNCGVPLVSIDEWITTGDCPQRYTIQRVYEVRDACNNRVSATQTITVQDDHAPLFDPSNGNSYVFECDEPAPLIEPFVSDACSEVYLDFVDIIDQEGGCPPLLFRRRWVATDDCGNASTFEVFMEQRDAAPPIARCRAAEIHLSESEVIIDPLVMDDGSFDECTFVNLWVQPGSLSCEDLGERMVQLIAEDACGNRDTCAVLLTITADTAFAFFTVQELGGGQFIFDASASSGDAYYWDFGNQENGVGQVVEYTYNQPGSFEVVLIATDTICGLNDTMSLWIDSGVTGVKPIMETRLEVFPNPSSGLFHLRLTGTGSDIQAMTVYNMLGQVVLFTPLNGLSASGDRWMLDLSDKPQGMYRLRVHGSQGDFYSTLVINY
jgi:hypothetical protein